MALIDNIKAGYKLEDVNDSGPNGYNLTNVGTTPFNAALINNGADLGTSNSSKYLYYGGGNMGITSSTAMTISFWVKLRTEIGAGEYKFVDFYDTPSGATGVVIVYYQYNAGTRRLVFTRFGNANTYVLYNLTMGTSNWYHIVITWDGSTGGTGYVNGSSVGTYTASGTGTAGFAGKYFMIGEYAGGAGDYASAIFDAVNVWNAVKSGTEVTALYNGGAGLEYPFTTTAPSHNLSLLGVGA